MNHEEKSDSIVIKVVLYLGLTLMVYLGSFGLLYLDEVVFSTHWVQNTIPVSPIILQVVYWPLLKLFGFT
ncbi:MAG TPA: hypothetical protein DD473_27070 [Planctomycetaceae bacterium]|nr:hypothetical protein [Planctomycetaceae bacterium]|tara:strand:- start:2194 stop:2403 length:210 start_codon:yes stop_codon:yes gene_type:complete